MKLILSRLVYALVLVGLGLSLVILIAEGSYQMNYVPSFEKIDITDVKRDSSGVLVITLKNTGINAGATPDRVALNGTIVGADRLSFGWNSTFKVGETRIILVDGYFTPGMKLDILIISASGHWYTRTVTL